MKTLKINFKPESGSFLRLKSVLVVLMISGITIFSSCTVTERTPRDDRSGVVIERRSHPGFFRHHHRRIRVERSDRRHRYDNRYDNRDDNRDRDRDDNHRDRDDRNN